MKIPTQSKSALRRKARLERERAKQAARRPPSLDDLALASTASRASFRRPLEADESPLERHVRTQVGVDLAKRAEPSKRAAHLVVPEAQVSAFPVGTRVQDERGRTLEVSGPPEPAGVSGRLRLPLRAVAAVVSSDPPTGPTAQPVPIQAAPRRPPTLRVGMLTPLAFAFSSLLAANGTIPSQD